MFICIRGSIYLQGRILPAPTPWSQHQATPHSADEHPPLDNSIPQVVLRILEDEDIGGSNSLR